MLTEAINRYIEQRRAVGFKYRIQGSLLRHFAAFAESRDDEFVQTQSVLAWAGQAPSPAQRRNRLLTIRRFARAMQAEDERHQIPPADGFGPAVFRRRAPLIFFLLPRNFRPSLPQQHSWRRQSQCDRQRTQPCLL